MEIETLANHESVSQAAARRVVRALQREPQSLLCLATGSTPARAFELLGKRAQKNPELFSRARILKLDEWEGLPKDDPGSCEAYFQKRVIRPWRISRRLFVGFAANARRPESECERIEKWLARNGPVDLCVLGLGTNGHLGLNEPAESLHAGAHRAALSKETRAHSMLSHRGVKPSRGLTLGMANILQSKQILLLVSGAHKRSAFKHLLAGELSTWFPASLLWLHPNTTVLCDHDVAQK